MTNEIQQTKRVGIALAAAAITGTMAAGTPPVVGDRVMMLTRDSSWKLVEIGRAHV